jgi:hypothetical protein
LFPSRLSAEQCSSEFTAAYKQRFVKEHDSVLDLTGGLGIDSLALASIAGKVVYIERKADYCKIARHNFSCLNAGNIEIIEGDASLAINGISHSDLVYVDPARREESRSKRLFALADCEPNLPLLLPRLWERTSRIIAKISPMADMDMSLSLLPETKEIHILSVRNECKELLFLMEKDHSPSQPDIYCINRTSGGSIQAFTFNRRDEAEIQAAFAPTAGKYVYEPNSSVLKAGAFRSITRLGVSKLHPNSHLYTSDRSIDNFPGRIFAVKQILPFNSTLCRSLKKSIPQANITTRNFLLSADELRRRTKISDGGNTYIFATTILSGEKVLIISEKESMPE